MTLPELSGSCEDEVSPGVVTPDFSVLGTAGPVGHLGDWKLLSRAQGLGVNLCYSVAGGGYLFSVCSLPGWDPNRQIREE